jgi:hypothetical protein
VVVSRVLTCSHLLASQTFLVSYSSPRVSMICFTIWLSIHSNGDSMPVKTNNSNPLQLPRPALGPSSREHGSVHVQKSNATQSAQPLHSPSERRNPPTTQGLPVLVPDEHQTKSIIPAVLASMLSIYIRRPTRDDKHVLMV